MTSEVEERPRVVMALYGGLGVNGLNAPICAAFATATIVPSKKRFLMANALMMMLIMMMRRRWREINAFWAGLFESRLTLTQG